MRTRSLPPFAPVLLESMRAIGYETSTAIADLIDNSITAQAGRVEILFEPGPASAVALIDDGNGMTDVELLDAMRHGSRSPTEDRAPDDLGRFGLGLKTASMSQCRRMTVVSLQNGKTCGMVWDLDDVAGAGDWLVGLLDLEDLEGVPFIKVLLEQERGTLVVWQKLDRLAAGDPGDGSVLSERMGRAIDHLSLVFHRYLTGRPPQLTILVNRAAITPLDPFLEEEGTIAGPEEGMVVEGHRVAVRAFTLPHISRLTRAQIERAGGEHGLRRRQGFYVYRNRRLIVWGTWFRLFRQEELTKLTRVRVDVPNALDHLWSLDIKKSAASPPAVIRDRLRGLLPTMAKPSRAAHRYRGRAAGTGSLRPVWQRIEDRDGIRYEVDPDHPVVAALRDSVDNGVLIELDNVLRAVSASVPIEALYNDRANERIGHKRPDEEEESFGGYLEELARQMLGAFADRPADRARLLSTLDQIEPFALHPKLTQALQKRLS